MSTDTKWPRVVLVDDHPALLRQTADLLSGEFANVKALEDGRQLLSVVAESPVDLIVLDITLAGANGIRLAARLRKTGCTAKIVFLTVHADADYAREAFEVGASAYVVKPRLASDLIPALRAALAGKIFVSPCPELHDFACETKTA